VAEQKLGEGGCGDVRGECELAQGWAAGVEEWRRAEVGCVRRVSRECYGEMGEVWAGKKSSSHGGKGVASRFADVDGDHVECLGCRGAGCKCLYRTGLVPGCTASSGLAWQNEIKCFMLAMWFRL